MEILGRNRKGSKDLKNCNRNKGDLHGLVNRVNVAEERISERKDISVETSTTEKQREKRLKKKKKRN